MSGNRRSRGSSSTGPTGPTPRTRNWYRKSTLACTRPTATRTSRWSSSRATGRASAAGTQRAGVPTKTRILGLREHLRGPLQRHRRPVSVADAVSVGIPEAHHLPDPWLLHGGRHLPRPADRLLCRVGRRVFPDAAGAQPGRAWRAYDDRAVADDELASH